MSSKKLGSVEYARLRFLKPDLQWSVEATQSQLLELILERSFFFPSYELGRKSSRKADDKIAVNEVDAFSPVSC